MKRPHLLRVHESPEAFSALFEAAREEGLRLGWLEWSPPAEVTDPLPAPLAAAAEQGAMRAVAVADARTVSIKPRRGPARLEDVLREHFLGCAAVLLRSGYFLEGTVGANEANEANGANGARLDPVPGGGWRVVAPGEAPRELTTDALVARLRRPRV